MKNLISILVSIFIWGTVSSQAPASYGNHWYFGNKAALDFTSGSPVAESGSSMRAFEACASVSKKNGDLLFYTNGKNIWNRNHTVMPNGGSLKGDTSSAQSLIVRDYKLKNIYYVFTLGSHLTSGATGGAWYSIVDMSLDGGLGDIVSGKKNIPLLGQSTEGITAARREDGKAAWIIIHQLGNSNFNAYLLDHDGFHSTPVVSDAGPSRTASTIIGQLKASHSGKTLVMTNSFDTPMISLFDFDAATGTVSNYIDLGPYFSTTTGAYGMEYSRSDSLLYLSHIFSTNYLSQINLQTKNVVVLAQEAGNYIFGGLQMGPDYKIYMARNNKTAIDVTSNPEIEGIGCNYMAQVINLPAGSTSLIGLPNYPVPPHYLPARELNEQADISLELFPNPASGILNILNENCNEQPGSVSVEIFNSLGAMVNQAEYSPDVCLYSIDISAFSPGIYYARLTSENKMKTLKFVRQ